MPSTFCIVCGKRTKGPRCREHRIRRTLTAARKRRIKERDGWRCTHIENGERCTVTYGLMVDHVIPLSAGGSDHPSNLTTLCGPHNLKKGDR